MRFERLDLNLLLALDTLLTERNVSVAAERLCLSQSAVSGALGRLREFFDDELMINTGRGMALTPRGESLVVPVRSVLHQIKTTITTKPGFDPATCNKKFTIVASDYALQVMLSGALCEIAALAPDLKIELSLLDDRPLARLERGEVDLLITLDHALSEDHPRAKFFEDDYVVLAWTGNTAIEGRLDTTAYYSLGHVSVQFGKTRLPAFEEIFLQNAKLQRRIDVIAPSFTSVPGLVVGTNRIATVQRRLADMVVDHMPLKIYPLPTNIPPLRQSIQWHRWSDQDLGLKWLVVQLQDYAERQSRSATPDLRVKTGGRAVEGQA